MGLELGRECELWVRDGSGRIGEVGRGNGGGVEETRVIRIEKDQVR